MPTRETFGPATIRIMRPMTADDIRGQLNMEITDKFGNLKAFTRALGVDYLTYRRYINGERKMSTELLMESLAVLDVDPVLFFRLVRTRIEAETPAAE